MKQTIQIGMIGAGVVGQGVIRVLNDNARRIEARLGAALNIRKIAVRSPNRQRDVDVPPGLITNNPAEILQDPQIDVVVELMGGVDPASSYVRQAIEAGKPVVTANKALLAEQGHKLIELAEQRGVDLYFEAAVAGGVPIIRVLREALASDEVISLRGIVNGTSNYILSAMQQHKLDFKEALSQAQKAGFAEADPTLDVSGGDAAHKLTLLATLAFGANVLPSQISTESISDVSATDIDFAHRFGYVIKSLAVARWVDNKKLELRVGPTLVSEHDVLASIHGALNAVYIEGKMLGPCLLSGYGAGALPTATSVVSDIIDVGRNLRSGAKGRVPVRSVRGEFLEDIAVEDPGSNVGSYYLRFAVQDQPGVLGNIATILGRHDVSIEHMIQDGRASDKPVALVMLTHPAPRHAILSALTAIESLPEVAEPCRALRIEGDKA